MKTTGMRHQLDALRKATGRAEFAYLMEQGTGKTWTILADVERGYIAGEIDGLLVLAPKGVHTNWTRREIPEHLEVPYIARAWRSGMGKKERAEVDKLLRPRDPDEVVPLRILAMNYDALLQKDAMEFALRFLRVTKALIAADESSRIKNLSAERTKRALRLRHHAVRARISSGSPVTNAPLDIFAQMEFLRSGMLGTTSYRAFVAEYADVVPEDHPMIRRLAERNPKAARAQIVARNPDGSPRYRNLDRLRSLIEPHAFRVLKRDCLDLPEKIYQQRYFELSPKQRAAYRTAEDDLRIVLDSGEIHTITALSAIVKLQQITSGFVNVDGEPMLVAAGENPRMDAFMDAVEDIDGSFIVWARFREELRQIAEQLRLRDITVVEYHGGVSAEAREAAVDAFQSGAARAFVGQPQSGGIGLTLTRAQTVVYFSNDFNMETRVQSEDRAHRIGTRTNVVYIDLVASDTIDEPIARALQRKKSVAAAILGDERIGSSAPGRTAALAAALSSPGDVVPDSTKSRRIDPDDEASSRTRQRN